MRLSLSHHPVITLWVKWCGADKFEILTDNFISRPHERSVSHRHHSRSFPSNQTFIIAQFLRVDPQDQNMLLYQVE